MDNARIALLNRRRAEAVRGAAQAAVNIADNDLIAAKQELCEAFHTVERMISAIEEET